VTALCECGAELRRVPAGPDDWKWVDEEGMTLVDTSPAEYRADPRGFWERLAATNIAAYSDLSARAKRGMLGWTHGHRPISVPPYEGPPPPWCCEMPMRLTPSGWRCRETKHPEK